MGQYVRSPQHAVRAAISIQGDEMVAKPRSRKYHSGNLIPMFRLAATLRKQMLDAGFTDNGGAIHSAERILNILGLCLNYPDLSHINNLRK